MWTTLYRPSSLLRQRPEYGARRASRPSRRQEAQSGVTTLPFGDDGRCGSPRTEKRRNLPAVEVRFIGQRFVPSVVVLPKGCPVKHREQRPLSFSIPNEAPAGRSWRNLHQALRAKSCSRKRGRHVTMLGHGVALLFGSLLRQPAACFGSRGQLMVIMRFSLSI